MKKTYDCGIDLGTTNSCIAKADLNNKCEVIDIENSKTVPSVVLIKRDGGVLVGARPKKSTDPDNVRREFKRDMGTDTEYVFPASGKRSTPIELSSSVLSTLRQHIIKRYGEGEYLDVIITVPAAFSMVQCDATIQAGKKAGFENIILLQEPIAAAIAYGAQPKSEEQHWLVFDFGGGTFDVSIISTKDGYLDNLNSRGDNHLGGKDIDELLYSKIILPKLQKDYRLSDDLQKELKAKLMPSVEEAKIDLSFNEEVSYYPVDLGHVTDAIGTPIDFECLITRKELEDLISDLIHKAIKIARMSLNESGLKDSDISRILLVGGTTFIPLVRNELKKEFPSIKLDSTLNPMTVVAEGAAIFANSQTVDSDTSSHEITTEFTLTYDYNFNTAGETENVCGTITSSTENTISKVKIDCISDENSLNPIWSSGWYAVLDQKTGAFDIDVRICVQNAMNLYKITAQDSHGNIVPLYEYLFTINHNSSNLKILPPPLPYSIGVLVNDGGHNQIHWITKKNAKLPLQVTSNSQLTLDKALDPDTDDVCTFTFYEGEVENACNPKANHCIGNIEVPASDLPRKVPKGTEVEITIDIDISRSAKISAYLPDYDIQLYESEELEKFGGKVNVLEQLTELEHDLDTASSSLNKLRNNGVNVDSYLRKLDEFKDEYDNCLELVGTDNDKVIVFINNFYQFQTEIIHLMKDADISEKKDNSESKVEFAKRMITLYGSNEEQMRFDDLKSQLDSTENPESREYLENEISDLMYSVIFNSQEWRRDYYRYRLKHATDYTNPQKAEYWKYVADKALNNNDNHAFNEAFINLMDLTPSRNNEAESIQLADIRIQR